MIPENKKICGLMLVVLIVGLTEHAQYRVDIDLNQANIVKL